MTRKGEEIISRLSSNKAVENLLQQMDDNLLPCYENNCDVVDSISTRLHCEETAKLVANIIKPSGMQPELRDVIVMGVLLHDVGKKEIPVYTLCKPEKLNAAEMELVFDHPARGAILIREEANKDLEKNRFFTFKDWQWDLVIALAAMHHRFKAKTEQRYSNFSTLKQLSDSNVVNSRSLLQVKTKGYGELLAVCDVFSAISTGRPYSHKRLASENMPDPVFATDTRIKASVIEYSVGRELNLSSMGNIALRHLSDFIVETRLKK